MEPRMFTKTDYGIIDFGVFNGKKWSELPSHYLEYLMSEECLTSQENKDIAKKALAQKNVLDGQYEMF